MTAFRLLVVLGLLAASSGCDGVRDLFRAVWPSPAPPEIVRLMPLPDGALVTGTDCDGERDHDGYLCLVKAEATVGMQKGADAASARMRGWQETSWDWVPGRIQSSWKRGPEQVSMAVFDIDGHSKWSMSYLWGKLPGTPDPPRFRAVAGQPGAKLPDVLADVVIPPDTRLLETRSMGQYTEAVFAVRGDPAAIVAAIGKGEWSQFMKSRTTYAHSAAWKRGKSDLTATVWVEPDGEHKLVLGARTPG